MKPEYMIRMGNKDFVLWPGLLDEAHDKGLVGLYTELLQIPTPDNQDVAIVKAKAILQQDNVTKTFEGIGDASPRNTTKLVGMALIRMAETRAKARALRDAVNIGMTAYEELDEEAPERSHSKPQPTPQKQAPKKDDSLPDFDKPHNNGNGRGPASDENILSDQQMKKIHVELRNHDIDAETANAETERLYGCRISDLSKANASKYIDLIMAGQAGSEDPDALCDEKDIKELTTKAMEVWGAEAIARTELTKLLGRIAPRKKLDQLTRRDQRAALREMGKMQESADRAKVGQMI